MIKFLIFLILCNFTKPDLSFDNWKIRYHITYPDKISEKFYRQIFDQNSAFVNIMNKLRRFSYIFELNEYADLIFYEFEATYLGMILPDISEQGNLMAVVNTNINGSETNVSSTYPSSADFSRYSLGVKNQFECGACWSFSVIGMLESKLKMLNPSYDTLLSEQYLIDCDLMDLGCFGGWPYTALNWLVFFGKNAVPSSEDYPYLQYQYLCMDTKKLSMNINATVQKFTNGNETWMMQIIAENGPVSAAIDVTFYFQLYGEGVFYDPDCNSDCTKVNHAVIVIGYGTNKTSGEDYWIVKNSWGSDWGENGYIYMSRNKRNNCNIACWAIYVY